MFIQITVIYDVKTNNIQGVIVCTYTGCNKKT